MKNYWKKISCAAICFILITSIAACAKQKVEPRSTTSRAPLTLEAARADYQAGNYDNALRKLTFLAINGDPEAQYALGYMYYYGLGTDQNIDIARGWFRVAAGAGFEQAQQALNTIDRPVSSAFPDFSPDL